MHSKYQQKSQFLGRSRSLAVSFTLLLSFSLPLSFSLSLRFSMVIDSASKKLHVIIFLGSLIARKKMHYEKRNLYSVHCPLLGLFNLCHMRTMHTFLLLSLVLLYCSGFVVRYDGIRCTNKFDFHWKHITCWSFRYILLRNKISIKMLILQKHFTTFYCRFSLSAKNSENSCLCVECAYNDCSYNKMQTEQLADFLDVQIIPLFLRSHVDSLSSKYIVIVG